MTIDLGIRIQFLRQDVEDICRNFSWYIEIFTIQTSSCRSSLFQIGYRSTISWIAKEINYDVFFDILFLKHIFKKLVI